MTGTVVDINARRGMVCVETVEGTYSIFEIIDTMEFEVGDVLSWDGYMPLGGETICNQTQADTCDVFFEDHDVPKRLLRHRMLYD